MWLQNVLHLRYGDTTIATYFLFLEYRIKINFLKIQLSQKDVIYEVLEVDLTCFFGIYLCLKFLVYSFTYAHTYLMQTLLKYWMRYHSVSVLVWLLACILQLCNVSGLDSLTKVKQYCFEFFSLLDDDAHVLNWIFWNWLNTCRSSQILNPWMIESLFSCIPLAGIFYNKTFQELFCLWWVPWERFMVKVKVTFDDVSNDFKLWISWERYLSW